jgi:hypothetical protein
MFFLEVSSSRVNDNLELLKEGTALSIDRIHYYFINLKMA